MKTKLFSLSALLIVLSPLFSMAQDDYHPLVVEGKEWRYTKESDGQQVGKGYVSLVIRGDTVINGTAYKKLLFEDDGETT